MKRNRSSAATIVAAGVALLLLPAHAQDTVVFEPIVFETIADPAFVGRGPGPDGFVGTDDDVEDPKNASGTVTYGISTTGQLLYSQATTTINEPYVFENGRSTITDFSTSGTLGPGFSFADIPILECWRNICFLSDPIPFIHEMLTDLQGRTDGEYSLALCEGEPPCLTADAITIWPIREGFFNQSSRGKGFLLRRGEDPTQLPGTDQALTSYLEQLIEVVPDDWTAIAIKAGGRLDCADWDPEAEGFLEVTDQTIKDTYVALQPSPDRVVLLRNNGRPDTFNPKYIYQNFELIQKLADAPGNQSLHFGRKQLAEDYGDLKAEDWVGVQNNTFTLNPDGVCVLETPGRVITNEGFEDGLLGMAGEYIPMPFDGTTIGGVVATVSTSPIEFIVVPTPVNIEIKPDDPLDPIIFEVEILGPHTFDVADVDFPTLTFGLGRAHPIHEIDGEGGHLVDGTMEGSSLSRVDFRGSVFEWSTSTGEIEGTLGVYDVPEGTSLVPVVASNIEFTATGMSGGNGSFKGWKNVLDAIYLDFTDEPPVLWKGNPGEVYDAFIEDQHLVWHLHPRGISGGKGDPTPVSVFHRVVSPNHQSADEGLLTFTTEAVPKPNILVSHYLAEETGFDFEDEWTQRQACLRGETRDGIPFEGCSLLPEPSSSLLQGATLAVLGLLVPLHPLRRRRARRLSRRAVGSS